MGLGESVADGEALADGEGLGRGEQGGVCTFREPYFTQTVLATHCSPTRRVVLRKEGSLHFIHAVFETKGMRWDGDRKT